MAFGASLSAVGSAVSSKGKENPVRLDFAFDGAEQFDRVMLGLNRQVTNLKKPYEKMADDLEQTVFPATFREIDNEGYKPIESGYVKYKKSVLGMKNETGDPAVLRWVRVRSDRPGPHEILYPSFVDKNHELHVREVTKDSLKLGSAVGYARDHHRGTGTAPEQFGEYPLPERNLLRIDNEDIRRFDRIFQRYLDSVGAIQGRQAA